MDSSRYAFDPSRQAPFYYRFAVGDAPAVMVSDGGLPLGPPADSFWAAKEDVDNLLIENREPIDRVTLQQNIMVIRLNGKLVLFDTGMGTLKNFGPFGPTVGELVPNLIKAGINPVDIDAVVLSHAHIDHSSGIMRDDGRRNFPNATYYISQTDFDFWTDEHNYVPLERDQARKNLLPNLERIHFVRDGEELLPGITAIHAPGHSPGHMMYMINSGKDQLCYIGDMAHHQVLLLRQPRMPFKFDVDTALSGETRMRMLSMLADNRIQILSYHFAWPGIGHIVRFGEGFHFLPSGMILDPA
jgi:glyoxylase-like metal-dependent hydrolase (beta-lactamase superfamily II)